MLHYSLGVFDVLYDLFKCSIYIKQTMQATRERCNEFIHERSRHERETVEHKSVGVVEYRLYI